MTPPAEPAEERPQDESSETMDLMSENEPAPVESGKKKKKKKKKKKNTVEHGVTALPKNRGTGFELYYADPPRTAEEAKEEARLYSPDRPFYDRIEECIQRYRSRRRMDDSVKGLFDMYLFLGGIDTSQRQFSGDVDTTDMDADEARQAMADVVIQRGGGSMKFYTPGEDGWDVDFYGVVAGTLSTLAMHTSLDYLSMEKGISVIENFLRYVLHHDVCPEFSENVQKAMRLCEDARRDLPLCTTALKQFPGQFNLACIELFSPKNMPLLHDDDGLTFRRPEHFRPEVVFRMSLYMVHDRLGIEKAVGDVSHIKILHEEERDLEVIDIIHPERSTVEAFQKVAIEKQMLQVVGFINTKTCYIEDGWWKGEGAEQAAAVDGVYVLDRKILAFLKPGMKLRVIAADLSNGLSFITRTLTVLPPWYHFLPQSLMRHWRDPCPDTRPARSVNDPPLEDDLVDPFDPIRLRLELVTEE